MLSAPIAGACGSFVFCGLCGRMPDGSYHNEMQLLIDPFFMGLWSVHFFELTYEPGCLDI
jgi:hypothetical protein